MSINDCKTVQDIIAYLRSCPNNSLLDGIVKLAADKLADKLEKAVNRESGLWLNGDKYEYEFAYCSKCCHMEHTGWNTHEEAKREIIDFCQEYKYCPNCGAHMIDGRYEESKRKRTSTKKGGV